MMGRYKLPFLIGMVILFVRLGLNLILPQIIRQIIDDVITEGKREIFTTLIVEYIATFLAIYVVELAESWTIFYAESKFHRSYLKMIIFKHLQELPASYYDNVRTGELMSIAVGDSAYMSSMFINNVLKNGIICVVYFFSSFIILFGINWKLTLFCVLISVFVPLIAKKCTKELRPLYEETRQQAAELNSAAQQNIVGVKVVRSFVREDYEVEKFKEKNDKMLELNIETVAVNAKYSPFLDFINSSYSIIITWVGGLLIGRDSMTLGEMVMFTTYVGMLKSPMAQISGLLNSLNQVIISAKRVFGLLDMGTEIKEKDDPFVPEEYKGDVEFENVNFAYKDDFVLHDISLKVKAGQTIGIMGATGSGKSTLVKLISRIYDVNSGGIKVDGVDVRNWKLSALRQGMSYVNQDTFLFSATINENVLYADKSLSKEDIKKAITIADADEFVEKLPEGYDTIIGERGVGLSGGQRQRLAIARAVAKSPNILIMDDCTSAVDMETERYIQHELEAVMKGKTTFIIAHRVSSVRHADLILFMDKGKIVESGTHEELLALNGYYSRVFNEQYSRMMEQNGGDAS